MSVRLTRDGGPSTAPPCAHAHSGRAHAAVCRLAPRARLSAACARDAAAPEVLAQTGYDVECDIWSLGAHQPVRRNARTPRVCGPRAAPSPLLGHASPAGQAAAAAGCCGSPAARCTQHLLQHHDDKVCLLCSALCCAVPYCTARRRSDVRDALRPAAILGQAPATRAPGATGHTTSQRPSSAPAQPAGDPSTHIRQRAEYVYRTLSALLCRVTPCG